MRKSAVIKSVVQAKEIEDLVDTFVVPIKGYSINYVDTFTLDEVDEIKQLKKEVFVVINKNIYNSELNDLRKLLLGIDKINIQGIIFYDVALVKLKVDLNLKTDLVWAQEHLVTNYQTINYWFDKGVKYAYLSSELNKTEIVEIIKNSKATLFINVFGYIPMFTSRRHIVNNYIEYFNLPNNNKLKKIYKEGRAYPIIDSDNGTTVYSDYILNITDEDFLDNVYGVYNSAFITSNDFKKALNGMADKHLGFLNKETIYKVKNNE